MVTASPWLPHALGVGSGFSVRACEPGVCCGETRGYKSLRACGGGFESQGCRGVRRVGLVVAAVGRDGCEGRGVLMGDG